MKTRDRQRRRNAAFVRQGEWFFLPAPDLNPAEWLILHNEPIRRGRGKPHMIEFLYREGGTTVHVCNNYPAGLTERTFAALLKRQPEAGRLPWRIMVRKPEAYANGRVRHADHKAITLPGWHRILVNDEVMTDNVAFLD